MPSIRDVQHRHGHGTGRPWLAQAGLTLIELMISIALGMLVVASAITLLLTSKSSYVTTDDSARLLDSGRYAIESISRAVRQTAFENLDNEGVAIVGLPTDTPGIVGFDASTFGTSASSGLPNVVSLTAPPSDMLQTRFIGAANNSVVNCAGVATPAISAAVDVDVQRGWSIFFVRPVAGGESELHCGYLNNVGAFQSSPIVSGVESFQLLYGLDADGDGIPDRFVTANTLTTLANQAVPPATPNDFWKKVVAVRVAILLRGQRTQRADLENMVFELFGSGYTNTADIGSRILESSLPTAERARTRKIFSTTIQLRNRAGGSNIEPTP